MHITDDPRTQLLERVTEGMAVVNAAGESQGKVALVKLGDPQAATTEGNEPAPTSPTLLAAPVPIGAAVGLVPPLVDDGEPDVEEPRRSHLIRMGYLKVDDKGLMSGHHYVAADEVASVEGDTVHLAAVPVESAQGSATVGMSPPTAPRTTTASPGSAGTTSGMGATETATWPISSPSTWPSPDSAGYSEPFEESSSRPWLVAAGASAGALALAGLGFWRWRQQRERPINRLRRQAKMVGQQAKAMERQLDARTGGAIGAALGALLALAEAWPPSVRAVPRLPVKRRRRLLIVM